MWLVVSLFGALFTSLTTILAKIGIKKVNSNFATMYKTFIVIIFSLLLTFLSKSIYTINSLTFKNYVFLILSGIMTGCSWICYYKALKIGDVNKIVPIDKSSFILTSILFVIFFFNDTTNNGSIIHIIMLLFSLLLMGSGTILMIDKKENKNRNINNKWLIYAILSSVFASLVSLFIKIGLSGISSDLGTLIRTIVVFIFSLSIVLVNKDYKEVSKIDLKSWLFLTLSSFTTGASWLCEYYCLNLEGVNPICVNSISKLSILLTMLLSFVILKEKFSKKSLLGLSLLTLGIIVIIVFNL